MSERSGIRVERIDEWRYRVPRQGAMRVDGRVFATSSMMEEIQLDRSLEQVANVACLPGILGCSLAMPDIHWGYGFPIGGVAATDAEEGVVSPGGVGYDINCGVRLLVSEIPCSELGREVVEALAEAIFRHVPTGVGRGRTDLRLERRELADVLRRGARWAVEAGFGDERDLDLIEEGGVLPGAEPELVSERAYARGASQLGSLGSGNHFAEVQRVSRIFDEEAAAAFGLVPDHLTVMIHSGSRGLGHQVCSDHLKVMLGAVRRYGISLPDRQLCCAPLGSEEGRHYLAAMAAAANFAFANRQVMAHWVRESLAEVLGPGAVLRTVYDVCHNIAKFEELPVDGRMRRVCVHRKGATRAYPAGHPSLPAAYREVGQPVLIPGDMGRYSYVLAGSPGSITETFGSSCHGAGRRMSRRKAKRAARGRHLLEELGERGVSIRAAGMATVAEEMPEAYKDVAEVVAVVEGAGLSRRVAELRPIAVVKG